MKTKKQSFLARAAMTLLLIVLTTMTAWAEAVTLTEDTSFGEGTPNRWYVNMPQTGTNTLTLADATITTFKVYDDGGKSGNYSDDCDGYLTVTAPEGYVLQLSGLYEIGYNDYLTVYDNEEASGTILVDRLQGFKFNDYMSLSPVVSTGRSMTFHFYASYNQNEAGLFLTVTLIANTTEYSVSVNPAEGGSVTANPTSTMVNQPVTLTATPAAGNMLSSISVKDGKNKDVNVAWDGPFYNTATFNMPASDVTVTSTFTNTMTADGGLYVNMPATGTKPLTIPSGVQSFKVYDNGGQNGNYSDDCRGTLVLTAPEGYRLQLSGSVTAHTWDYLNVYDGNDNTADKLLYAVSSTSDHTPTDITTVVSSGRNMTLYFYSSANMNSAGLDLTVMLISAGTMYDITVNNPATGGTVTANPTSSSAGQTVTLSASSTNGYLLSDVSVTDGNSNVVPVTGGWYTNNIATFKMPGSAVTVTPTFTNNLTADGGLYINMPTIDSKTATIPAAVQSFKVYDNGGQNGSYSDLSDGTLVLTVPAGYVLQLSGNVMIEGSDYLSVFDGSDNTATTLIDQVGSSPHSGVLTPITTVTSSGQNMTLYFHSDYNTYDKNDAAGLDLTVTVVPISYTITYHLDGGTADNPETYTIESAAITLTNPTRTGYDFAGWTGTNLDAATQTVTIAHGSMGNREYTATWTENVLELANASDNTSAITAAAEGGKSYNRVTLDGRTLYKDGDWNTLCLPFDVTLAGSPLEGATVKKLTTSTSKLEGSTLTLYFEDETTTMTAGTPYLVKWTKANDYVDNDAHNLVNPVFTGVTIDNTMHDADFDGGSFKGTYSSIAWNADNQSILFLGAQNKLYWPKSGASLGAQRAYFQLNSGTQASEFVLNFDGESETTGIISIDNGKLTIGNEASAWYTMNGVKLDGKPNKPGLYINNGRKVVIK